MGFHVGYQFIWGEPCPAGADGISACRGRRWFRHGRGRFRRPRFRGRRRCRVRLRGNRCGYRRWVWLWGSGDIWRWSGFWRTGDGGIRPFDLWSRCWFGRASDLGVWPVNLWEGGWFRWGRIAFRLCCRRWAWLIRRFTADHFHDRQRLLLFGFPWLRFLRLRSRLFFYRGGLRHFYNLRLVLLGILQLFPPCCPFLHRCGLGRIAFHRPCRQGFCFLPAHTARQQHCRACGDKDDFCFFHVLSPFLSRQQYSSGSHKGTPDSQTV